ncbi:hypothetical protein T265_02965 [Opisthorchis viverrini]|uniref:Uncharacterized protein n=1 Tax=Opisthorchis viverrini TaxID=6198 RepID=A0A074ZU31_OPIVI|nr:hypothetical protein T265_02965 [Opisthorchis viverrini]KER30611.1 hypothetical protein T265_02965 [Opisthorchis viverrini]
MDSKSTSTSADIRYLWHRCTIGLRLKECAYNAAPRAAQTYFSKRDRLVLNISGGCKSLADLVCEFSRAPGGDISRVITNTVGPSNPPIEITPLKH